MVDVRGQCRAGQSHAGQDGAGPCRAGQGRAGQSFSPAALAAIESIMRESGSVVLASILAALAWSAANLSSCRNIKYSQEQHR